MLTIAFEPSSARGRTVGPVPYFKIDKDELKAGPDDSLVARHKKYQWEFQGSMYTVLNVPCRCKVSFEGCLTHGPFEKLRLVDGYIRTADPQPLAHYDEKVWLWFVHPENKHCSGLTIEPA